MSRDLASSLREDRRISKEQSATEKDKQRVGNSTDESALLIGSPSRGPASAGQPETTSEQLDSANESPALIGHEVSSLEQERRAEGEVSVDDSCSHVMEQQQQAAQDQVQQQQAVQDQVQQQQLEPDWEARRQEKS
jgi:hypothetical protein